MSYPYPLLLSSLQLLCTVEKYQQLITPHVDWRRGIKRPPPIADYWRVIPRYTYAYCPICYTRYHEPVDTYSLLGWGSYNDLTQSLYVARQEHSIQAPCPHFLGLHSFLNLHDQLPREIEYLNNRTGEVPYLTPWFFQDDMESYVVLHALPICRTESNQFAPTYTMFSLTYFSQDPKLILQRHFAVEAERGKGDPEYHPATVYPAGSIYTQHYDETLYDLAQWAVRGQLGWLDFTVADQPLRLGVGSQLPETYQRIHGNRKTYVWRKGSIQPF